MHHDNDNKKPGLTLIQGGKSENINKNIKAEAEASTAIEGKMLSNHDPNIRLVETKTPLPESDKRGEVKLVRISTGEVLIGFMKLNGNFSIWLTDPLLVSMQVVPGPGGTPTLNLAMMDYMPYSKDNVFEFLLVNVLHMNNPDDGFAANYRQKVSGLIVPPNSGKIIQ